MKKPVLYSLVMTCVAWTMLWGCSGSQGFDGDSRSAPSKDQNAGELNDGDDQAIEPQQVAGAFLCEPVPSDEYPVSANEKGFGCGVYSSTLQKVNLDGYSFNLALSGTGKPTYNVVTHAAAPTTNYHTFAAFPTDYMNYQEIMLQVVRGSQNKEFKLPVASLGSVDIPKMLASTVMVSDDPNAFELAGSILLGGNELIQATIVGGGYDGIPSDAIGEICGAAFQKRRHQASSSITKEVGGLDLGFDSYTSTFVPDARTININACTYGRFEPFKKSFGDSKRLVQRLGEGCFAVYIGLKSYIYTSSKVNAKFELEQKIQTYNLHCSN